MQPQPQPCFNFQSGKCRFVLQCKYLHVPMTGNATMPGAMPNMMPNMQPQMATNNFPNMAPNMAQGMVPNATQNSATNIIGFVEDSGLIPKENRIIVPVAPKSVSDLVDCAMEIPTQYNTLLQKTVENGNKMENSLVIAPREQQKDLQLLTSKVANSSDPSQTCKVLLSSLESLTPKYQIGLNNNNSSSSGVDESKLKAMEERLQGQINSISDIGDPQLGKRRKSERTPMNYNNSGQSQFGNQPNFQNFQCPRIIIFHPHQVQIQFLHPQITQISIAQIILANLPRQICLVAI